ncbi:hypothetical protein ABVK25_002987 [Lepraria finkii]|uniref:Uncharacterized protein n=1 Tax=Lepraria finkii TaxID=1340010 RepID=A0ABR4BFH8_9LECA
MPQQAPTPRKALEVFSPCGTPASDIFAGPTSKHVSSLHSTFLHNLTWQGVLSHKISRLLSRYTAQRPPPWSKWHHMPQPMDMQIPPLASDQVKPGGKKEIKSI